jgi:hypothetical protein
MELILFPILILDHHHPSVDARTIGGSRSNSTKVSDGIATRKTHNQCWPRLSNTGGNAVDIVANIPSIAVDVDDSIILRGSENVRMLIDGKPSGLTSNHPTPLKMIDHVEVITNPSSHYDAAGEVHIIRLSRDQRRPLYKERFLTATLP